MERRILKRHFAENKVIDSYSKVARIYNFWSLLTETKAAKKVIKTANIKDGECILEVAVGTGLVFKEIVKRNPNGINWGIDISPDMLSRAGKRLNKFNISNFSLDTGNAYHLSFNDNSFDLVVNNFMLDLLPENDFSTILSEFHRVLKPAGRAVISTMAFGQKWHNKFWHWIARTFPDLLTGCRPVSLVQHLKEAGFLIEKTEQVSQNTFPSEIISVTKP